MSKKVLVTGGFSTLLIVTVLAALFGGAGSKEQGSGPSSFETKMAAFRGTEYSATPLPVDPQSSVWEFKVTLTTHAGSLDFDVAAASTLRYGGGTILKARSWTGGRGGHHLDGTLGFPATGEIPGSFTLTVNGAELSWQEGR